MRSHPPGGSQPEKSGPVTKTPGTPRPSTRPASRHSAQTLYAVAAIAWLGFLIHNVADCLGQTFLSPETLWRSLLTAALLVLYAAGLTRAAALGLAIWAALNLVGGALSVLPLPVLPFQPRADPPPLLLPPALRHYPDPAPRHPSIRLARRRPHRKQPDPTDDDPTTG